MTTRGFTLFPTAIGICGIAWSERGVLGLHLPDTDGSDTRARLARRFPGAVDSEPPAAVQQAIDAITALLDGRRVDLSAVALDMEALPPFHRRVYDAARRIPAGRTRTYGEIAAEIGEADARAVGQALGHNPYAIIVPCHRVLAAGGQAGGFSAPGGVQTKLRLLAIERARPHGEPDLFD
ncbi:methylated-DNA--[protein]-cysteine S-methyltransferase [Piscinibacter sp. XHJ-5]|uniref:methylated-DNA--[protein]-cysteine S-methyltransferase n=1 Tax=Piscinibacter sp. XHJ-5 TaxID=3037797 RepID=UPI00245342F8|nr:methylated-DNA--[protein]-cysteine S-methyltransferase [Piscinibacter sp. XHJ-5]